MMGNYKYTRSGSVLGQSTFQKWKSWAIVSSQVDSGGESLGLDANCNNLGGTATDPGEFRPPNSLFLTRIQILLFLI